MEDITLSLILAFVASIAWGFNSHIMKIGIKDEKPMKALFIRALAASPILLLMSLFRGGIDSILIYFEGDLLFLVLLTSILVVLGDGIFMFALKKHDVKKILPIAATYPLVTTILLLISGTEIFNFMILFGTVFIIIGVGIVSSKGDLTFDREVLVMGLMAGTFWGTSIFFVRLILEAPNTNSISVMGIRTLYMGLIGISIYIFTPKSQQYQDREKSEKKRTTLLLLMSGIIGWVLGAAVFFEAVDLGGASMTTPISSTNPIIAILIGKTLGLEEIDRKQLIGIISSVIGTIIIVIN